MVQGICLGVSERERGNSSSAYSVDLGRRVLELMRRCIKQDINLSWTWEDNAFHDIGPGRRVFYRPFRESVKGSD